MNCSAFYSSSHHQILLHSNQFESPHPPQPLSSKLPALLSSVEDRSRPFMLDQRAVPHPHAAMEQHVAANWNPVWVRQQILANASALHPALALDVLTAFTHFPHTVPGNPNTIPGYHFAVLVDKGPRPSPCCASTSATTHHAPPHTPSYPASATTNGNGGKSNRKNVSVVTNGGTTTAENGTSVHAYAGIRVLMCGARSSHGETHALLNLLCDTQTLVGQMLEKSVADGGHGGAAGVVHGNGHA